jgi:hypothetical protein
VILADEVETVACLIPCTHSGVFRILTAEVAILAIRTRAAVLYASVSADSGLILISLVVRFLSVIVLALITCGVCDGLLEFSL